MQLKASFSTSKIRFQVLFFSVINRNEKKAGEQFLADDIEGKS